MWRTEVGRKMRLTQTSDQLKEWPLLVSSDRLANIDN